MTRNTPAVSPSHHVSQIWPKPVHGANPPSASHVTPFVALNKQLTTPPSPMNAHTLRARASGPSVPA